MAFTEEQAGMMMHEAKQSAKSASGWGILGTLLGAAGTATGITALATKVPKNNCGCNNNGYYNNGCGCNGCGCNGNGPTPFEAYQKSCADEVALASAFYNGRITQLNERFADRQVINGEMFNLYESQIDADFNLYKNQRDQFDVLKGELDNLKCQVAVNTAVRPYQDALIQCDINNARKDAEFDLFRRTCRMIQGEVVLPNTPTVTGYPSYGCCNGLPTPAAPGVDAVALAGKVK